MQVGAIGYDVHSGLGHLLRDFHANGVVQRAYIIPHPRYERHREWYVGCRYEKATAPAFLSGLTHLFIFENAFKSWWVVEQARARGAKIVLMPMYEWTPDPLPVRPDLVLCPSDLDYDIFRHRYKCVRLNVPVEREWKLRERAKTFVHNAGHGQVGFAKGTPEVIEAWRYVKSDARLIVRGQPDEKRIRELEATYFDSRTKFDCRQLADAELFATGDVYINAERYNGLSLPLQEAYAAGMPVVTTDRYPANTWLPKAHLIQPTSYDKHRVNHTTFDRALIEPKAIAEVVDRMYDTDIRGWSTLGRTWATDNSWKVLGPKYMESLRCA